MADTPEQHPGFFAELREQRWDDHRLYHHSRINQSLHLLSALSFLTSYVLLAISPAIAAIVGWVFAMWSRQVGHFFFEPKGYDDVNKLTNERKEEIKVGYNIRRKIVLLAVWAASPVVLWLEPTLFGLLDAPVGFDAWLQNLAMVWLALGGTRLVHEDPHGSISRREALPPVAAASAARAAHRPDAARALGRHGRSGRSRRRRSRAQARGLTSAVGAAASGRRPKRARRSSLKIRCRIALFVSAGALHHQPSACIASAARTNRSATAAKSASE
jgi:hypothetical protein